MTPLTRPATHQDLPALLAVEGACFDRPWPEGAFEQELELTQAELWVAEDSEQGVVGYVDFWVVAGDVELLNIAVVPSWRRHGLARLLLDLLDRRAAEREGEQVFLEVRRGNAGAIALYRSVGYSQVGLRRRYYSDGEDAILMGKALAHGTGGSP